MRVATLVLLAGCASSNDLGPVTAPSIDWRPETYVCYRTPATPAIDGRLDEDAWRWSAWTKAFVDIVGPGKSAPRFVTRAKMVWDDRHLYVGAEMEEPDVRATLTKRDSYIYRADNDFEVFIDPDGDTHAYFEIEINARNTVWDLMLLKPYRDGGRAIDAFDIAGLKTAVRVDGTLNDPKDTDRGWSVEMAIPWAVLKQATNRPAPPRAGDQWWINLTRVQWQPGENKDNGGIEDNWVWSPQGLVAMHYPEMWGLVQFSGEYVGGPGVAFRKRADQKARAHLWQVYYRQRAFLQRNGRFAKRLSDLKLEEKRHLAPYLWPPKMSATATQFEASLQSTRGTTLTIRQDGLIR